MDKFTSQFVQGSNDTIIEESKLTLNFKNFKQHEGEIVSLKMKLQSIDAEWWIVIGTKEVFQSSMAHYVPVYVRLCQKPDQIQDVQKCRFGVAITVNGQTLIGDKWYKASNDPTWSSDMERYKTAKQKNLVLDVVFTIKRTEIAMIRKRLHNTDVDRAILLNLSKLLKEPVFSDFTFIVKGKEIKAHKGVLAAGSPVFNRLFLSNLKESLENVCKIKHIEPEIFEDLLHFIYAAKLPENFEDRAKDLFEAAHFYEIEQLKKICAEKVQSQLSVENATDLCVMGHTYDLEDLKKSAWDIVKRDVLKIDYRIRGEPLSPKALHKLIENRKSEQELLEDVKVEVDEEQPPLKQMKLGS